MTTPQNPVDAYVSKVYTGWQVLTGAIPNPTPQALQLPTKPTPPEPPTAA